jgi:hypothetical protein
MSTAYSTSPRALRARQRAGLENLYDAWAFAADDAGEALHAWAAAKPPERATAHAVYRAALDREESAADALMLACRRAA